MMKLESKYVHFSAPFLTWSGTHAPPRFTGKEKNMQLRETALVIEGKALKVRFILGIEDFFQRALTEHTSLTIPYQRMEKLRIVRWPAIRVIFLTLSILVLTLAWAFNIPMYLSMILAAVLFYPVIRIRTRFELTYRNKQDKQCVLCFSIRSKPLSQEFDKQLGQYLAFAEQHHWNPKAA